MDWSRGPRRKRSRCLRRRDISASLLALASAGLLLPPRWQQAHAQVTTTCGTTSSSGTTLVENLANAKALSAAVNCTDGGPIDVLWSGPVTLDAPISIGAGTFLSITGEDDLAEVEGGLTRLFDVSPGGGLTLTQMKLSNGNAENGGAITSSLATLTLDSCVFENNVASTGDGGAVWAKGGNVTIVGGEFLGNAAHRNGGAVYAIDASMSIAGGTTLEGNQAVEGGAVYCGGEDATTRATSTCSLSSATFSKNNASSEYAVDFDDILEDIWGDLYGGGGAAFFFADVDITDCVFSGNSAQVSAGALYGGNSTSIAIDGCRFEENNTTGYGAAVVVSSATVGGGTVLSKNAASKSCGALFGWDQTGRVELNDVECTDNTAGGNGGCLYVYGEALINSGTSMLNNVAEQGGCIYAFRQCDLTISGGEFTCEVSKNGAFMYASDGAAVNITDGLITGNVAARRGGVVYCSGDSNDMGGAMVTIEGGRFTNNEAQELGGAIVAWGDPTVVKVKGGYFFNNTAKFYGGFVFLEEGASLLCEDATILENYAGDQGGGIYARDATWVKSSCDLLGNESPQGAAAYLTYVATNATFENLDMIDNVASGGSVFFAVQSSVLATGVTFDAGDALLADNRAVQLDSGSSLVAKDCTFAGWLGDTVIHNANAADASLVLDSCDFTESAATTVVLSPNSDAEIRNAMVGDTTLKNVAIEDGSPVLVDRALNCSHPAPCGAGACVDSSLGVLCECLEDGQCLDGGGALSVSLLTPPSAKTYSPDLVSFKLSVLVGEDGTTPAIWNASFEADELSLEVVPSSGVVPLGGNITVTVTGSPLVDDVGGNLTSRFVVTSVASDSTDSTNQVELEVESTFYLCRAFEYALPDEDSDDGISCEQCAGIDGAEGVDCDLAGATLACLPVMEGYWRSSNQSLIIHSCVHPDACVGATEVTSSDDYCKAGYKGPYCAVCTAGYGKGVGNTCHACDNMSARFLITAGAIFSLFLLLLLLLALVFLVGGLDAVGSVRRTVAKTLSISTRPGELRREPKAANAPAESKCPAPFSGTDAYPMACSSASSSEDKFGKGNRYSASGRGVLPLMSTDGRVREGSSASADTVSASGRGGMLGVSNQDTANFGGMLGRSAAVASLGGDGVDVSSSASAVAAAEEGRVGEKQRCCGVGDKIKRWGSRLPFDKLKILVVVWQILTVFPTITAVDFPPTYSRFLSWVDFVNLDLGEIFSASCIFPTVNFYQSLLITTLAPIFLAGVLVGTYHLAKSRAGIGSAGVVARRAAWSRHMAAGLLLTFLVFTSASTAVFKTFACDKYAVDGESYLRADYSLSCKTDMYLFFKVYAGFMLLVYPVGIPVLYAFILWTNRHSLNPSVQASARAEGTGEKEEEEGRGDDAEKKQASEQGLPAKDAVVVVGQRAQIMSPQELQELEDRVQKRKSNPDLVPSMFLWKDFGPDMYYYEVIECGRRILLTGVLIFIAPHTAAQAAMACIFAFGSLLGFELLRPHLDPTDMWLYRLGCVVIFLSNFLALLIKVDAAGDGRREALGALLVAVNVVLVLAVLLTTWFATQQSVEDARDEDNPYAMAKTMITAERLAANSARLSRDGKSSMSSAPSSVLVLGGGSRSASVGPSGANTQGRLSAGSGGVRVSRGGGVSAADVEKMWQRDKAQGGASSR